MRALRTVLEKTKNNPNENDLMPAKRAVKAVVRLAARAQKSTDELKEALLEFRRDTLVR